MPLESAQMLCTAHRVHSDEDWCDANGIYKTAYKNHPCTIWARTTSDNYLWLYSHFIALCSEYTRRYGKEHLSFYKIRRTTFLFTCKYTDSRINRITSGNA